MADASARYIAQRVLADVEHLAGQGHLSASQVDTVRNQLSALVEHAAPTHLTPLSQTHSPAPRFAHSNTAASAARAKVPPPPPPPQQQQQQQPSPVPVTAPQHPPRDLVKAVWGYDASGGSDEVRFAAGDTLEVLERLDDNWWKGRHCADDTVGLFPAAYVEAVEATTSYPPAARSEKGLGAGHLTTALPSPGAAAAASRWKPPAAKWSSGATPAPTPSAGTGAQAPAPYAAGPAGLQPYVPTEEEKEKRDKFKKMGGRLGTSVATGAAFGVGAGLASNLF
ncbi:unnamed protein product [Parajaminaea phylloscopi]